MPVVSATCRCPCRMPVALTVSEFSRKEVVRQFKAVGVRVVENGSMPPPIGHWVVFDKGWLDGKASSARMPSASESLLVEPSYVRELEVVCKPYQAPANGVLLETYSNPKQVFEAFKFISRYPKEVFLALLLDAKGGVLGYETVSIGTEECAPVVASCAFRGAVLAGASRVIFLHNHPSQRVEPSSEDLRTTQILIEAGRIMGVQVLDHIVISECAYYSMLEHNHITALKGGETSCTP